MPVLFTNNATATLAASISTSSTTVTLATGQGALFPSTASGVFYVTLYNSSNNIEICRCTSRAGDVLTVVRGQEGTSGFAFSAGDKVDLRVTAAALNNFAQLDANNTFSGASTFSGTTLFSGAATFNSTALFSGVATFSSTIVGSINGNAATATNATNATNATTATTATTATSTPKLATTNFTIEESGGKLIFKYGATTIASMTSAGVFTTLSDITAGGTP